jgi:hypothetical protein
LRILELPVHQETEVMNGGSTFIAAIVTTAFACLVIGFAAGKKVNCFTDLIKETNHFLFS